MILALCSNGLDAASLLPAGVWVCPDVVARLRLEVVAAVGPSVVQVFASALLSSAGLGPELNPLSMGPVSVLSVGLKGGDAGDDTVGVEVDIRLLACTVGTGKDGDSACKSALDDGESAEKSEILHFEL